MGEIDELTRQALIRATMHLVNREYARLSDDFVQLGFLPAGSDKDEVVPALTGKPFLSTTFTSNAFRSLRQRTVVSLILSFVGLSKILNGGLSACIHDELRAWEMNMGVSYVQLVVAVIMEFVTSVLDARILSPPHCMKMYCLGQLMRVIKRVLRFLCFAYSWLAWLSLNH